MNWEVVNPYLENCMFFLQLVCENRTKRSQRESLIELSFYGELKGPSALDDSIFPARLVSFTPPTNPSEVDGMVTSKPSQPAG